MDAKSIVKIGNKTYIKAECELLHSINKSHLHLTKNKQLYYSPSSICKRENLSFMDYVALRIVEDETNNLISLIGPEIRVLPLPLPSEDFINKFIENYNQGKGVIKCILVEVVEYIGMGTLPEDCGVLYKVKVDSHNQITIKPVKASWTKEGHCQDMQYYMEYCLTNGYVTPMVWIDKLKHY